MQDILQGGLCLKVCWVVVGFMWVVIVINYIDCIVLLVVVLYIQKEFYLSVVEMGVVMLVFFWLYVLLQLLVGILVDCFGQKKVFGFVVLWWFVVMVLIGLVNGFKLLVGLCVVLGIGEVGVYLSSVGIIGCWFFKQECVMVVVIFDSGFKLGSVVVLLFIVWLLVMFDWKIIFVVMGVLGIVWVVVWWVVFKEMFEVYKGVNIVELVYIQCGLLLVCSKDEFKVFWMKLLMYWNIWVMCIGFFMINYNLYFFIMWLLMYFVKECGMGLMQMGFMVLLLLFVLMFVEVFVGWVLDWVYVLGKLLFMVICKFFFIIGLVMVLSIGLVVFV